MKNIIFSFLLLSILFNQDIAGDYRLTGVSAVDYDFARYNTNIMITESSGLGIEVIGDSFYQGEMIEYSYQPPANELLLQITGVILNVTFTDAGMALITEGSTYPTAGTENCVTTIVALPVTGEQGYSSDLTQSSRIPTHDIIGLQSLSPYRGMPAGRMAISQSQIFDLIPLTPTNVSIPFPIDTSSVTGNNGPIIPADTILPGMTAGYVVKNTKLLSMHNISGLDQNNNPYLTRPSLYFEWQAIDGEVNESGFGDDIDIDEDEDGTDFDSVFGLSSIYVTKVKPLTECNNNFSYPIAGRKTEELKQINYDICVADNLSDDCNEYSENWIIECIDQTITSSNSGQYIYAIDPNYSSNPLWKGLLTYNSQKYNETNNEAYLIDDSDHDFNPDCLNDGNLDDCSGRFKFDFAPQCIQSFNMRHFMVEMIEECEEGDKDECGVCFGNGQVTWYIDNDYDGLGDPESTSFTGCLPVCEDNDSDGYCDDRYAGNNYDTCVPGLPDECGICNGPGPLEGYDCQGNELSITQATTPKTIEISSAYPNPFNPLVNIELLSQYNNYIELDIIDLNGKQITKLFSGYLPIGKSNYVWNAKKSNPSGIYLIRVSDSGNIFTKKILLIK